jgi:hypothetical protein
LIFLRSDRVPLASTRGRSVNEILASTRGSLVNGIYQFARFS